MLTEEECQIQENLTLVDKENGVKHKTLEKFQARYASEVWKSDETYYSPTSLKVLLAGIQRSK